MMSLVEEAAGGNCHTKRWSWAQEQDVQASPKFTWHRLSSSSSIASQVMVPDTF